MGASRASALTRSLRRSSKLRSSGCFSIPPPKKYPPKPPRCRCCCFSPSPPYPDGLALRRGNASPWPRDHRGSFPPPSPPPTPRLSLGPPAPELPPPHPLTLVRRFRRRWTQGKKLLGPPTTPALVDPPLRLTPLVARQNGARGRALTSRPFPLPVPVSSFAARRRRAGPQREPIAAR